MITIKLGIVPSKPGTSDPWQTATAVIDGHPHVAASRSCSICKLGRMLRERGIPDDEWTAYTERGVPSIRGRSIYAMADKTIYDTEPGLRMMKWYPHPKTR